MNINDFLDNNEAIDYGAYYIVTCPSCKHREAFLYKTDIEKHSKFPKFKIPIYCNRAKNCGITSYVDEAITITKEDKAIIKEKAVQAAKAKNITSVGKTWLSTLISFADRLNGYDMNIRGIKNETLKKYKICYLNEGWINTISRRKYEFGKDLFKYSYIDRDLLFPVYNLEGRLDRILLRSLNKNLEKKEIQVKMYDDAVDGFNLLSIANKDVENIFFTEGIYDALSVIEAVSESKTEAIGVPGVKKWKGIIGQLNKIESAKDKTYIIAFDNDEAGKEFGSKFYDEMQKQGYKTHMYILHKYKDLNEFYQAEPIYLKNSLKKYLKYIKK